MPATVIDGRSPFRLTLASPATVDGSGTIVITPANLLDSAGEFDTIEATGLITATGGLTTAGASTYVGSDTFTVGSANVIVVDNLANILTLTLPTYADNAAALAGGLVADNVYKTATGEPRIVVPA